MRYQRSLYTAGKHIWRAAWKNWISTRLLFWENVLVLLMKHLFISFILVAPMKNLY